MEVTTLRHEAQAFQDDGVRCVRNVFDPADLAALAAGVDALIAHSMTVRFGQEGGSRGHFLGGRVRGLPGLPDGLVRTFEWLSFESPAPRIAGELMQSDRVRLFGDAVFVKEPGSEAPTPWHHDYSYWPLEGDKICSVWIPLDEVTAETGAVRYLRGSHRSARLYAPAHFRSADDWTTMEGRDSEFEPAPTVDERALADQIVQFDVQPGDCVVHHARTVHGAPGNASTTTRRRAVVVRYADEHTRYSGPRFAFEDRGRYPELAVGSELDGAGYPVAWSRDVTSSAEKAGRQQWT